MLIVQALPAAADAIRPMPGLPSGLPALPHTTESMLGTHRSGLALRGFDPVAYRLLGQATPGRGEYELTHRGTVWRFANAGNREAFRDAPAIYEPAFEGFDPSGIAEGRAVESDPRHFAIISGRLYLFRSAATRSTAVADPARLSAALERWPEVSQTIAR
jgi:hypothetical protein